MSENSAAQKKRIAWVDIAKGFTILTVIWSHALTFGSLPRNLIFCFHMPLFFILSGFTLKPAKDFEDLVNRTKKDFARLILPVIFILIATGILNVLLNGLSAQSEFYNFFYKLFWANGIAIEDGMPAMGMPWFLVSLFLAKFLIRIFSLIFTNGFELVSFLCGFIGMMLGLKHIWLPLNLDMMLVCMMFVAGGMLACNHLQILQKYKTLIFILSAFFVYQMLLNGQYIEFAGHSYTVATIIEGFAASYIVCALCRAMETNSIVHKIFCFIGVNTMPIFLTHHLDWFLAFLYISDNMYIACILRTLLVLLLAFIFTFAFRTVKHWVTTFIHKKFTS